MKYIALVSILLLTAFTSKAQDTIIKRNNEKTAAKIIEINSTEIKFKRFDYPEGPVFTLKNWEIKYIIYANGVKELFENYPIPATAETSTKSNFSILPAGEFYYYKGLIITEPDALDILKKVNDKKINLLVEKTREKKFMQKSFLYGGLAAGSLGVLTAAGVITVFNPKVNAVSTTGRRGRGFMSPARIQQLQTGGYFVLGGILCEIASFTFKIQEKRTAHIAVDAYNKLISP